MSFILATIHPLKIYIICSLFFVYFQLNLKWFHIYFIYIHIKTTHILAN